MIMTIVLFFLLPMLLGQVWKDIYTDKNIIFTYISGFFSILAIFELLGPAMIYATVPFHVMAKVISIALAMFAVAAIVACRKEIFSGKSYVGFFANAKRYVKNYSKYEWVYLTIFLIILGIQVYYAACYDIGGWRSDDYHYLVISSSAIYDDGFFLTSPISGEYTGSVIKKYASCGIYVYYAYVSYITGLKVPIVAYTLCTVLFLVMSYGCIYLLAKLVYPKEEERDQRLIFLIVAAAVSMVGLYSHYSLAFRIFGTIHQGKAFLAVVVTPFLLATYPKLLWEGYSRKKLLLFMMTSLVAISLTVGGNIVIAVIPGLLTLLYLIRTKNFKSILYLFAVGLFPLIDVLVYLFY